MVSLTIQNTLQEEAFEPWPPQPGSLIQAALSATDPGFYRDSLHNIQPLREAGYSPCLPREHRDPSPCTLEKFVTIPVTLALPRPG